MMMKRNLCTFYENEKAITWGGDSIHVDVLEIFNSVCVCVCVDVFQIFHSAIFMRTKIARDVHLSKAK